MAKLSQSLEKKFGENGTRTLEMKKEKEKKAEEKRKREERKLASPKEPKEKKSPKPEPQKLIFTSTNRGPITPSNYKEARKEREERLYELGCEYEDTQEKREEIEQKLFNELGLKNSNINSVGFKTFAILDREKLEKDLKKLNDKITSGEFVYFDEVFKPNYYYNYSGLKTWAQDLREIPISFFNGEICEGFEGFVLGSLIRSNNTGYNTTYHFFHLPFLYDDFCARGDNETSRKVVQTIISLYKKGIIDIDTYTENHMDTEVFQSLIISRRIKLTNETCKKLVEDSTNNHSHVRLPIYYRMFYYPIFTIQDILVYSILRRYTKAGYECLLKFFPETDNNLFKIIGITKSEFEQSLNKLYHLKVIDIRNLKRDIDKYDKIFITFLVNFDIPQPKEVCEFIYKEKDLGKKYNDYMRRGKEIWKTIMKPFREENRNTLYKKQYEFISNMYDELSQLIDDMTLKFEGEKNLEYEKENRGIKDIYFNPDKVINKLPTAGTIPKDLKNVCDAYEKDDQLDSPLDKKILGEVIEKTFDDEEMWFRDELKEFLDKPLGGF